MRAGKLIHLSATPAQQQIDSAFGGKESGGLLGVSSSRQAETDHRSLRPDLGGRRGRAAMTWQTVETTGFYVGRIFTGSISASQLHGAIGTATVSGEITKKAISYAPNDPAVQALAIR